MDIRVDLLEPFPQFRILLSIFDERVGSIGNDAERLAVRKPLEKGSELRSGLTEGGILCVDAVRSRNDEEGKGFLTSVNEDPLSFPCSATVFPCPAYSSIRDNNHLKLS